MIKRLLAVLLTTMSLSGLAQKNDRKDRLTVFIDCSSTWCDMTYIRSEITVVNFSLDRLAADVHVLVTSTDLGGGGNQYQLIFYGQNDFVRLKDTLRFDVSPTATDFEKRELLANYMKMGIASSVAKTLSVSEISVNMKSDTANTSNKTVTDKWNYWVFRLGIDGNVDADQVYQSYLINGRISANRITNKSKISFKANVGINESTYDYDGVKQVVNNRSYGIDHSYVKSFRDHFGLGYEISLSSNTFSNSKHKLFFRPAIEYNFFPYSEVNNKLLALGYGPFIQHNNYVDSTIFDRSSELLFGHLAVASLILNQKWGSFAVGMAHRNFFHDWRLFNTGSYVNMDVRITGGLSFYIYFYGGITRDQIYLVKGDATPEEVLTRQRALASAYHFQTYFGFTYRFGSILNNFVNPRFDGPGNYVF